jgi:hypothetical protein
MNEGGQSSTGQVGENQKRLPCLNTDKMTLYYQQLIDFVLTNHPAYSELVQVGKDQQKNIHVGASLNLL